jgi:hypothetical protein
MSKRAGGGSPSPETSIAAALYIATMAEELAQMARQHGLDSLCYILEMARLEADQVAKSPGERGGDAA